MKIGYLFITFLLLMITFSCNDPCSMVDCGLHGTCLEGDCECDPGYDGKFCENQTCGTEFFEGTFLGYLNCTDNNSITHIIKLNKLTDTRLHMIVNGETVDLNLDLFSCTAKGNKYYIFYNYTYTLTRLSENALQLEVEITGIFENHCNGTVMLQ